jgi:anti-sigma-K factor RskA
MTCPVTVRLGVYALGSADAAERLLIESHLVTCPSCRAEMAGLEPLPGLLAQVPVTMLRACPSRAPARDRQKRAASGRWRGVAGIAAAAAAIAAATGVWLAQPGTGRPPAAITLSGANPVTHVRVTATLTGTSWGTSIRLLASGLPLNQTCRLIVRSRSGGTEITGVWQAWADGPVTIPASAAWRPADIASLQIATTSKNLVTITASRTGAQVAPSPSGSGQ